MRVTHITHAWVKAEFARKTHPGNRAAPSLRRNKHPTPAGWRVALYPVNEMRPCLCSGSLLGLWKPSEPVSVAGAWGATRMVDRITCEEDADEEAPADIVEDLVPHAAAALIAALCDVQHRVAPHYLWTGTRVSHSRIKMPCNSPHVADIALCTAIAAAC